MIQEAIYGRRQIGRCIEAENSDLAKDPRYLGCYADVLGLLDAKCSGKKECELRIPDPDLDQATSCVKSLRMFLEIRYTCVEGAYGLRQNRYHYSKLVTGATKLILPLKMIRYFRSHCIWQLIIVYR